MGRDEAASSTLPVYYHWEFATGSGGDFETLARPARPQPVAADVGRRPLRVGTQPFGLPDGGVLQLEGALVAPGPLDARRRRPPRSGTSCARCVNLAAGKPVVAPPVYGRWQSARDAVPADADPPAWLRELNLDPSARAVAGLGVVVVQKAQEELVAAAWNQLGDPTAVRGVERRLEVAVAVLGSVVRRRLEPMDPGPARAVPRARRRRGMLTSPETLARRAGAGRACPRRSARRRSGASSTPVGAVEGRLPARAAAVPGDRDPRSARRLPGARASGRRAGPRHAP